MSFLQRLRERFWFLPAVMCMVAGVLAQILIALDRVLDDRITPGWAGNFVYQVGASGSRDILGVIASSSLAVAGTTFSITIAVLALTSSTYGPRLVRNFMTDRGNQAVLGVYVATFLYSLLVLRAVRVIGDPGNQDAGVFVPHLAVNVAMLLAVANVAVLVYFIHHISDSIQVSTLTHRVRTELVGVVDRLYPEELGESMHQTPSPDVELAAALAQGDPVHSAGTGYIQSVDDKALLARAEERDVLLVLRAKPGDYVIDGAILGLIHPAERSDEALRNRFRRAVHVADARSPYQDVTFAVQQLTEMAVRAVSPGTNDPYTAINALDDLGAGLSRLVSRALPSPDRLSSSGVRRIYAPRTDPAEVVADVLDSMRWYASSDPGVMLATLVFVERIGQSTRSRTVRARLLTHLSLLDEVFRDAGHCAHDADRFTGEVARIRHTIARG